MGGRLSGILVSKFLKPRTMIFISLITCIGSSVLLVSIGETSKMGVYVGTCKHEKEGKKFLICAFFYFASSILKSALFFQVY